MSAAQAGRFAGREGLAAAVGRRAARSRGGPAARRLRQAIRASALGSIADEQRIDSATTRDCGPRCSPKPPQLRRAAPTCAGSSVCATRVPRAGRQARRAPRPRPWPALLATLDAHLDAAHRLRLAHDQWLAARRADARLRIARAAPFVATLAERARESRRHPRRSPGPRRSELRPLAQRLVASARRLALVEPPAELAPFTPSSAAPSASPRTPCSSAWMPRGRRASISPARPPPPPRVRSCCSNARVGLISMKPPTP